MNVVKLSKAFSSGLWRQAFAEALIKFRPDMNPDAVDELSDSAYLSLANLLPGDAAARYTRGGDLSDRAGSKGVSGSGGL
jgi:hypothetical protein